MNATVTLCPVFYTVSVRYCCTKPAQFSAGLIATGAHWPKRKVTDVHEVNVHLILSLYAVFPVELTKN